MLNGLFYLNSLDRSISNRRMHKWVKKKNDNLYDDLVFYVPFNII